MRRPVAIIPLALIGCASVPQDADLSGGRGEGLVGGPPGAGGVPEDEGCITWAPGFGEWGGAVHTSLLSRTGYDFDAGIAAALEQAPATGEVTGLELRIEDAVVTNVGSPRSGGPNIWFEDAGGALRTYAVEGTDGIAPGDLVSMTITAIDVYGGEIQISDAEDVSWTDADEPVHVVDQTAGAVNYPVHGRQNVFTWGEITGGGGGCGGSSVCVDYEANGQNFVIRIGDSQAPDIGACMVLLAPLGTFNQDLQINIDNYDWRVEY
jgi:hypothetical protein